MSIAVTDQKIENQQADKLCDYQIILFYSGCNLVFKWYIIAKLSKIAKYKHSLSTTKVLWIYYEEISFVVRCYLPVFAGKCGSMEKSGLQPSGKLGDLRR